MKKALYYRNIDQNVICELCPHMCQLGDGELGTCRTRINKAGELYTLAYNNLCALNIDPVEKKPLCHFLPQSKTLSLSIAGCNLRCLNCQNASISQVSPLETKNRLLSPREVVDMAIDHQCPSISFTYTDPVVYYEYMLDVAILAQKNNIRTIMVSSGYINSKPLQNLMQYLDAANIDLKCFDDAIYQELCGAKLKPVLNTIRTLFKAGIWIEIACLIVPGYSDDLEKIRKMLDWFCENSMQNVPVHINRFVPSHQLMNSSVTPVHMLNDIADLAKSYGMNYIYIGNVRSDDYQDTVCQKCNRHLIQRSNYYVQNDLIKGGQCPECSQVIHGVWE